MTITSQSGSVQKKVCTQTCSSPLPTIPPGSTDTARRSQIRIKGWRSGRGWEGVGGGWRGWEGAVVRLSINTILFPVQRVAKIEASRAAAIFFFFFHFSFFSMKILSIFGGKKM